MKLPTALWRFAIHAFIGVVAFALFDLGVSVLMLALGLTLVADKVWPNATLGNCWLFVGPRLVRYGGAFLVQAADGPRFLKMFPVPHALMVHHLGTDSRVEQTVPLKRTKAQWFPWPVVYFPFRVVRRFKSHDSSWSDL